MGVGEFEEIIPVFLVEAGEGGQDQDGFAVPDWVDSRCEVVHVVVHDWRWCLLAFWGGGFFEW